MRAVTPNYNNNEEMRHENKIKSQNDISRMMMMMMVMFVMMMVNSTMAFMIYCDVCNDEYDINII